jgi:hypothetical protein
MTQTPPKIPMGRPSGRPPDRIAEHEVDLPEDLQWPPDATPTRRFGYLDMIMALGAGLAIGAGVLIFLSSRTELGGRQQTADEWADLKRQLAAPNQNSLLDNPKFKQCLLQEMRGQPNDMLQVVWPMCILRSEASGAHDAAP